jgi:hypothetical protein
MTVGQIIALVVGIFLAIVIVIGHASLVILAWCCVGLAVAVLFGGVPVRTPSA